MLENWQLVLILEMERHPRHSALKYALVQHGIPCWSKGSDPSHFLVYQLFGQFDMCPYPRLHHGI